MKKKNHVNVLNQIVVDSKTVSRNRVRIPTRSLRHLGVKPGQRVLVFRNEQFGDVEVKVSPKGNYTVERDGSVRFPANKFGVHKEFVSQADRTSNCVVVL
jgi:hypothetical protein